MRIPKSMLQNGSNQAIQEAIFIRKMKEAEQLEKELEAKTFEFKNDQVRVVCNGMPKILELNLLTDCTAKAVLNAINQVLAQAHLYRDGMARHLIGRK